MTHAMTLGENEIDYQYDGYVVRAKNTFIDITPKRSMTRSRSCTAVFQSYTFNDSKAKSAAGLCDTPSTTCSEETNRGPFALSRKGSDDLDSRSSDAEDSEAFVAEQFQKYFVNTDNSGTTLMWHGLPTKYHMKPDLIRIIEDIDAQGVTYLYLPLNHWEKSRVACGKCRNKGYAFVHFKTTADAEDFTRKVSEYTIESRRSTATTLAAHQGVSLNLTQLVTAPQKRTAAGTIYLPNAEGKFECVTIASLRKLHKLMGSGK